jgi:hypothetical protein
MATSSSPLRTVSTDYAKAVRESFRERALERLYERKAVVDNLIASLEQYQQEQEERRAEPIDISAARKCWSGSAQLRI